MNFVILVKEIKYNEWNDEQKKTFSTCYFTTFVFVQVVGLAGKD